MSKDDLSAETKPATCGTHGHLRGPGDKCVMCGVSVDPPKGWDAWYARLPDDLKRKLSIHDFKRLGDLFAGTDCQRCGNPDYDDQGVPSCCGNPPETPRTDVRVWIAETGSTPRTLEVVDASFARELEHELAETEAARVMFSNKYMASLNAMQNLIDEFERRWKRDLALAEAESGTVGFSVTSSFAAVWKLAADVVRESAARTPANHE